MLQRVTRRVALAAAVLGITVMGCAPAPAMDEGGIDAEAVRAFLLKGIEENKAMDLRFAEAIPDSAMTWAPNADVRNFAQQVAHAADNYWTASGLGVEGSSFSAGSSKADLVAEVTRAYDWLESQARALPAEEFTTAVDLFGTPTVKWRVFTQALEHATWTRGQLVPYFHAHNVAVPQVVFF